MLTSPSRVDESSERLGLRDRRFAEVAVENIEAFVQTRLREAKSPVREVQQMVSALEMIAEVHRDVDGYCNGCDRPWACLTIRHVAWTWRAHGDYDHTWHWTVDDLPQGPLTDAEKVYLIEHAGISVDSFDPERVAEARAQIAASIERSEYVLPVRGPWGLSELIAALPHIGHSELVALLNAPLSELHDSSPIEWLADGGSAWVVMEALLGVPLHEVAERASRIWPLSVVPDWLVGSNDYLDGARPIDVIRLRGPAEVLAALDAEEQLSR